MATKERIVVAMSGGVDSAVAAGLLIEQGYDLVGVTMHLWDASGENQVGRCCSPVDRDDARRVCEHLGIPHYVIDERESFRENVVNPFVDEYLAGRTPSPCVHCNRTVKLTFLQGLAAKFGARRVATGHYARLESDERGETKLLRGRDLQKDQSYFLFGVPGETLGRLIFPVGNIAKGETRAVARRLGLPNADKADSQELCFVPDGKIREFVERDRGAAATGRIVDEAGTELGTHKGIAGFTVGQRKGLGLGGGPVRYVLKVLPESNDVVVGPEERLSASSIRVSDSAWIGQAPDEPFEAHVRIRYRHQPAAALVTPSEGGFDVVFDEAQRAAAPGQAAVVYQGEEVLGGGFIA